MIILLCRKEELLVGARKRVECEKKAMKIVERLLEESISESFFEDCVSSTCMTITVTKRKYRRSLNYTDQSYFSPTCLNDHLYRKTTSLFLTITSFAHVDPCL